MARLTTSLALGASALALFATPAHAEDDDDPVYAAVPDWVTTEFDRMRESCLPNISKIKFKKRPKDVPFMPRSVAQGLQLAPDLSWKRLGDANLPRFFGYVFTPAEEQAPDTAFSDSRRFLQIDYAEDGDRIPALGFDNILFNQDCGGALRIAADAHGDGAFASATLAAAADSAIDRRFSARISIARGMFANPLPNLYYGIGASTAEQRDLGQLFAALLFWDWYTRNGVGTGNYRMLQDVRGVSLYRFTEDEGSSTASARAEASLGIPFFSASFESSGSLSRSRSLKLEAFRFGRLERVDDPDLYTRFTDFPALAAVHQRIAAIGSGYARLSIAENEDDIARPGTTKSLILNMPGVPSRHCGNLLEIGGTDADRYRIVAKPEMEGTACRIPISYRVPATGGETLDFTLTTRDIGFPAGVGPFTIPVTHRLSNSPTPMIEDLRVDANGLRSTPLADNVTRLSWTASGMLSDDGFVGTTNDFRLTGFSVGDCFADPERLDEKFALTFVLQPRVNAGQRPIELTVENRFRNLQPGWETRARTCRASGMVTFMTPVGPVNRLAPGFTFLVPDDQDTLPEGEDE